MISNPFHEIEQISQIVSDGMNDCRGVKYPTHWFASSRNQIARVVRSETYAARGRVEQLQAELKLVEIGRDVVGVGQEPTRSVDQLEAHEALKDWQQHVTAIRIVASEAQLKEAEVMHALWQKLSQICDHYLGLDENDWAFG